jgi:hypothetical protein
MRNEFPPHPLGLELFGDVLDYHDHPTARVERFGSHPESQTGGKPNAHNLFDSSRPIQRKSSHRSHLVRRQTRRKCSLGEAEKVAGRAVGSNRSQQVTQYDQSLGHSFEDCPFQAGGSESSLVVPRPIRRSGARSAFSASDGERSEGDQAARHHRTGYQPQEVVHIGFVSQFEA